MTRLCCMMCMAVLSIATVSCAGETGQRNMERSFGSSYRLAIVNQTLNPNAGRDLTLVEGLDGRAAQSTYDQYLKSFDKAQKEPTYLLGIGGSPGAAK
jgi:hypothetical protein